MMTKERKERRLTDNQIRQLRFGHLCETIDYYAWMVHEGLSLSKGQKEQLQQSVHNISCFGEDAQQWVDLGNELLKN